MRLLFENLFMLLAFELQQKILNGTAVGRDRSRFQQEGATFAGFQAQSYPHQTRGGKKVPQAAAWTNWSNTKICKKKKCICKNKVEEGWPFRFSIYTRCVAMPTPPLSPICTKSPLGGECPARTRVGWAVPRVAETVETVATVVHPVVQMVATVVHKVPVHPLPFMETEAPPLPQTFPWEEGFAGNLTLLQ